MGALVGVGSRVAVEVGETGIVGGAILVWTSGREGVCAGAREEHAEATAANDGSVTIEMSRWNGWIEQRLGANAGFMRGTP